MEKPKVVVQMEVCKDCDGTGRHIFLGVAVAHPCLHRPDPKVDVATGKTIEVEQPLPPPRPYSRQGLCSTCWGMGKRPIHGPAATDAEPSKAVVESQGA